MNRSGLAGVAQCACDVSPPTRVPLRNADPTSRVLASSGPRQLSSTEYIEVDEEGWANRQVEIYGNGRSLKYDRLHWIDFHGELFDLPPRGRSDRRKPLPRRRVRRDVGLRRPAWPVVIVGQGYRSLAARPVWRDPT